MKARAPVGFKFVGAANDGLQPINQQEAQYQPKKLTKSDQVIREDCSRLSARIRDELIQKKRDDRLQIINTAELANGVEWRVAFNDESVLGGIHILVPPPSMTLTFKDSFYPAVGHKFRKGSIIQLRYSAEKAHIVAESRSNKELFVCAIIFFLSLLLLVIIMGYGVLSSPSSAENA